MKPKIKFLWLFITVKVIKEFFILYILTVLIWSTISLRYLRKYLLNSIYILIYVVTLNMCIHYMMSLWTNGLTLLRRDLFSEIPIQSFIHDTPLPLLRKHFFKKISKKCFFYMYNHGFKYTIPIIVCYPPLKG